MTRTETASRLIAAPPERIYEALIDPAALATWLPPQGMTGRFDRYDARPGGPYGSWTWCRDGGWCRR